MCPEPQDYNEQADVWSVGILMWQLLTGGFPFWTDINNLTLQQVMAVRLHVLPRVITPAYALSPKPHCAGLVVQ